MFADGFVGEVVALLGAGLREGVTAARALGYAQVIADLDGGGDGTPAREPTFFGTRRYVPPPAVVVLPRPPHRVARWRRVQQRRRHAADMAARILNT